MPRYYKLSLPFRFSNQNFVCISPISHACYMSCYFILLDLITLIILAEVYKSWHFSDHLPLPPSWVQIISSPRPHTPSICILPLGRKTKCQMHTKQQAKLYFCISQSLGFSREKGKAEIFNEWYKHSPWKLEVHVLYWLLSNSESGNAWNTKSDTIPLYVTSVACNKPRQRPICMLLSLLFLNDRSLNHSQNLLLVWGGGGRVAPFTTKSSYGKRSSSRNTGNTTK